MPALGLGRGVIEPMTGQVSRGEPCFEAVGDPFRKYRFVKGDGDRLFFQGGVPFNPDPCSPERFPSIGGGGLGVSGDEIDVGGGPRSR